MLCWLACLLRLLTLLLRLLPLRLLPLLSIAGELDLGAAADQLHARRAVTFLERFDAEVSTGEEHLLALGQVLSEPLGLLAPQGHLIPLRRLLAVLPLATVVDRYRDAAHGITSGGKTKLGVTADAAKV